MLPSWVGVRGQKGSAPVVERKQGRDVPQRRHGDTGRLREPMVCGCGLGHPHRHLQRRASGVFYGVGAIGMARTGNNRQGLADVRMKGIMNRHGGRHGAVESVSSMYTITCSFWKGSISIAPTRT